MLHINKFLIWDLSKLCFLLMDNICNIYSVVLLFLYYYYIYIYIYLALSTGLINNCSLIFSEFLGFSHQWPKLYLSLGTIKYYGYVLKLDACSYSNLKSTQRIGKPSRISYWWDKGTRIYAQSTDRAFTHLLIQSTNHLFCVYDVSYTLLQETQESWL